MDLLPSAAPYLMAFNAASGSRAVALGMSVILEQKLTYADKRQAAIDHGLGDTPQELIDAIHLIDACDDVFVSYHNEKRIREANDKSRR